MTPHRARRRIIMAANRYARAAQDWGIGLVGSHRNYLRARDTFYRAVHEETKPARRKWGELDAAVWETPDSGLGFLCVGKWECYRNFSNGKDAHVHFIEY